MKDCQGVGMLTFFITLFLKGYSFIEILTQRPDGKQ